MSGQGYGYPNQFPQQPPQGMYPNMYPNINPSAPPSGYPYQPPQPGFFPNQPPMQQHQAAMSYATPNVSYQGGYVNPPVYEPVVEWIRSTPNDAQMLSHRAVVGGYEGYDNSPLWVIRSRFEGDLIPGKLAINHKAAYVAWGGNENAVRDIEVCCARPEKIRWVECREGNIPPNAVVAGTTRDSEPLYVGRAREQGSLTPGKVHPSHKVLYISFAGKEVPHRHYEIMCTV